MRGGTDRQRPMFVVDLAVPRDVEPTAGRLRGVTLVDIDGLRASVAVRAAETAADIERAHAIVADEVRRFSIRRRAERLGRSSAPCANGATRRSTPSSSASGPTSRGSSRRSARRSRPSRAVSSPSCSTGRSCG